MIMTTELEGRIQIMCKILVNMIKQSMKTEQFNSIERMLKVNVTKRADYFLWQLTETQENLLDF